LNLRYVDSRTQPIENKKCLKGWGKKYRFSFNGALPILIHTIPRSIFYSKLVFNGWCKHTVFVQPNSQYKWAGYFID